MDYEETRRMMTSMRGRRYLACRALQEVEQVIENLPDGPYSQLRENSFCAEGPFPGSSAQMKHEMRMMTRVLLRMILAQNDGRISHDKINGF